MTRIENIVWLEKVFGPNIPSGFKLLKENEITKPGDLVRTMSRDWVLADGDPYKVLTYQSLKIFIRKEK